MGAIMSGDSIVFSKSASVPSPYPTIPSSDTTLTVMKFLHGTFTRCTDIGVSALDVSIVAGEFYKFTDEERVRTLENVVEEANGKLPVWAGIA
jgi:hypothetical protein